MRRIVLAAAAAMALAFAGTALAITNGEPDGNGHPEVGALLAQQAFSDGTWEECTGTLISPTVFLTAAHCDEGVSRVAVTFDSSYHRRPARPTGAPGTPTLRTPRRRATRTTSPSSSSTRRSRASRRRSSRARLARVARGHQQFTSVGYGAQTVTRAPAATRSSTPTSASSRVGTLNSINASWLRISQNPSTGNGGTCYGDSGGPNFLGAGSTETNIVAATTITGDSVCRSTNVDYRLDTPSRAGSSAGTCLP